MHKVSNYLTIALFTTVVLYAMFQIGRWYEYKQAKTLIDNVLKEGMTADYIIPDNEPKYPGEMAEGYILTPSTANYQKRIQYIY